MKNAFKLGALALVLSASMVACKGSSSTSTTDSTKKDSTVTDSTVKVDSVKKDSTKADTTKMAKDTTKKM